MKSIVVVSKVRTRLTQVLETSPFLKHILTLLSGTVIAQILVLTIELVLARIYTPEQAGRFALYMSVTSVVIVMASGRYDMTIMLPKDEVKARVLQRLASRLALIVSLVASVLALVFHRQISAHYGGDEELAYLFAGMGGTVFLVCQLAIVQYWLNRHSDYGAIAQNRVIQSVGSALGKVFFGVLGLATAVGLYLGQTLGQLVAWLLLRRKTPELREPLPEDAPTMGQMALRYKKMPLLNGPNALIDAIRLNGINILIAAVAVGQLGQFDKAWTLLQAPIALINGAVAQVFFHKLATVERGHMTALVRYVLIRATGAGLALFVPLYFLAPWLFPFLLGQKWAESGLYAQAIVPWLFMTLLTSPISQIFVVTETQQWLLGFSVLYCVAPLSLLYFSPWSLLPSITALGLLMAVLLLIMLLLAWQSARRFDRRADPAV